MLYKLNILFIVFFYAFVFTSCSPHFTKMPAFNRTFKKIPNKIYPRLLVHKDSMLSIEGISFLSRFTDKGALDIAKKMKVSNHLADTNFLLLKKRMVSVAQKKEYKIQYTGNGKNDSLFKSLLSATFNTQYHITQMQQVDFTQVKEDGIQLIVTHLVYESPGIGGGSPGGPSTGAGYIYNTLYEFFNIRNGKVVAYTGYSLGRSDFFFTRLKNCNLIKPRDIRLLFKRWYRYSKRKLK